MPESVNYDKSANEDVLGRPNAKTCPAVGYQKVNVCVPVTVKPFVKAGVTKTKCCCDPMVIAGDTPCCGKKNGVCTFTINQTICVEVPVDFGATAMVGDTYVDCIRASAYDITNNNIIEEDVEA